MNTNPKILCLTLFLLATCVCDFGAIRNANAKIVSVSGTVVLEPTPYPGPSDTEILVFDEQQAVSFVDTQPLDFGNIAPGTLVNSHYLQFDPENPLGSVGLGSVTFDGPILGVVTLTANLTADLNPDVSGTSDTYFGLELTLGPYPAGIPGTEQFRGLGSPLDSLTVTLGSNTLVVESFDVNTPGALDAVRILTAVPEPSTFVIWVLSLATISLASDRHRRSIQNGYDSTR